MKRIDVAPHELKTVKEILEKTVAPETLIIIFGSRIKGTHKKFSDLDICLKYTSPISSKTMGDLRELFECSNLPYKVDLVDYRNISPAFQKIVDKEGNALSLKS